MSLTRLVVTLAIVAASLRCAPSEATLARQYESAEFEMRRGRLSAAQVLAEQGVARTSDAPASEWAWRFRLLVADILTAKLETPRALELLQSPIPDHPNLAAARARQKFLLARVRVSQGDLKGATALVDEALPMASVDPPLALDIEIVLRSQLLYRSGKWAEAEALLNGAVTRAAAAGDTFRQAMALNNLGMGLVIRNRFDEAVPYFERILSLTDLDGTSIYGAALNNAGVCYARLGQFERAVALQRRAIAVHEHGRQRDYLQALGELGSTYLLQDDIAQGIPYLQRALQIASEARLPGDAALWARNLAAASVALGNWDDAARFNEEARRLAPAGSGSGRAFSVVTDAQIAAGRGRTSEAATLFSEALAVSEGVPAVRWMAYDGLARLAVAGNRPDEAAKHFEAALETVEKTRSALLRTDYRISFPSRLIHFYRGYVDLLLDQGQVERALEVADSSRGRVLAERQGVAAAPTRTSAGSLKQLARQANAVLLFYWLGPQRSALWLVEGSGIRKVDLPPADRIEALVAEHHETIQNAMSDPLGTAGGAGDRLYDMLIGPVAARIPRGASVVIVPDGALHRLNFETLPVRQDAPHYWIEDVTVQVAPSLAMLQRAGARSGASASTRVAGASASASSLLLVGNPTPRAPEFPALGYAPAEMEAIRRHFASATLTTLDGERASPAGFKGAGPERFSIIHFTSHAVANIENPLDSAVILSGTGQDFKLYARDVAAMPLSAELVTVSACRSAGERAYSGEGLVGFAWAFLRAGTRRVVAGLWDVDDRSTALLMDEAYRRLAAGASPPAALREAKLALIRQGFPRPYYWAPFQVFTVIL
ncbi:MAG: CHAT domain-containing protein [Acidobacteria bacterium]|nr:CHAT domain-containing protein [Acidobacteriota bacterium]